MNGFTWFGDLFSPESYLFWSRIQGPAWTLADFVIVYYVLRLANLCRGVMGRRPHRFAWLVLAGTIPFAATIPFIGSGTAFFQTELVVTVTHFLIILYVLAVDVETAAEALARMLRSERPAPDEGVTPSDRSR
jgi:hypothetical protein